MRFACDGCNAKYMISDDKVGPAGVKVRCKKCGHVILVRHPEPEAEEAGAPAHGLGVEWWVAIADQPVGPVSLAAVQHHWDAGEIGPESLVWYAGLVEWTPLGSVPELHGYLMGTVPPPPPEGTQAPPDAQQPEGPGADPEWRPGAASALAALEESTGARRIAAAPDAAAPGPSLEATGAPAPASPAEAAPAARDGVGGGVDPTGVVPLPMAGLDRTGEKRIGGATGAHRMPASRPAPRNESRSLTVVLSVALVLVAAVAAGLWWLTR